MQKNIMNDHKNIYPNVASKFYKKDRISHAGFSSIPG